MKSNEYRTEHTFYGDTRHLTFVIIIIFFCVYKGHSKGSNQGLACIDSGIRFFFGGAGIQG